MRSSRLPTIVKKDTGSLITNKQKVAFLKICLKIFLKIHQTQDSSKLCY